MAQGKLKVKAKLPSNVKSKAITKNKGSAIQRRRNAPVQRKKSKFEETQKLKKLISKTVNNAMENELREKALEGKKSLVKKNTAEVTA